MKKRICFLLTLIISMIIGVKSVMAEDADLVCIYGKGNEYYKLLQKSDKQYLYQSQTKDIKWNLYEEKYALVIHNKENGVFVYDISDEEYKDEKKGTISECPPYLKVERTDVYDNFYIYYDQTMYPSIGTNLIPLIPSENDDTNTDTDIMPDDINVFYYKYNDIYKEEVNKKVNDWIAKCSYYFSNSESYQDVIYLYFNENEYVLINENSLCGTNYLDFSVDELNESFKELYQCPVWLFLNDLSNDTTGALNCNFSLFKKGYRIAAGNIENVVYNAPKPEPKPDTVIKDCKDLFGEKLIEQINKIMDIIKIVIPILLIAFGVIDFTKSIFAGSEDNMKKAQRTFFSRILAAVLVFIAPILINLILSLSNEVWGYINPESCIK